MLHVPDDTPVTIPPDTVAIVVAVLLHVPPAAADAVSVTVAPGHTFAVPLIDPPAGRPLTVTALVVMVLPQVLVSVYFMFDVPVVTPVTRPLALTVALLVALLVHAPPGSDAASTSVAPAHNVPAPVITAAVGTVFTVATVVAAAVPQLLVHV